MRSARRRFGAYWLVVRPFSGLVRRRWLSAARQRAEALTRIHSCAPDVVLTMAPRRASAERAEADLDFERLYAGHRGDVYRAALRELGNVHDAEDVTQAAFIDAYRAVLRGTRPESPRAWLLAIAENVRRRRFRTAQRRPREEPLDRGRLPPAAELPYEQTKSLAEALASLPAEQRRVFLLREILGLSYDEIADQAGSTVASIQMLLFRARRSLREQLDPPTATRRPVFVPPAELADRALLACEARVLTPRAAGALGAAVLTVAGASVAVPVPQAGIRDASSQPQQGRQLPVSSLPGRRQLQSPRLAR